MKLIEHLEDYKKSPDFRALSTRTQYTYSGQIKVFFHEHPFLECERFTEKVIRPFLMEIHNRVPTTLNGHRAVLKHFYRWLRETERITHEVNWDFTLPHRKKRRREPVPADHVLRIVQAADVLPCPPFRAALYRAAVNILIYSGMRRSEIIALADSDFDPERCSLHIRHGKGDKARKVYVSPEVAEVIEEYRKLRGKVDANSSLLQWQSGRIFGESGLTTSVSMCCKLAGTPVYCCHRFRHSYGTRLVNNGVPLPVIQSLMGHSDLAITGIYTHAGETQLQDAACVSLQPIAPATYGIAKPPRTLPERAKPQEEVKPIEKKAKETPPKQRGAVRFDGRTKDAPAPPQKRIKRFVRRAA